MGFDLDALTQAARQHGPIARVVVADVVGSTPRDTGASMLVWKPDKAVRSGAVRLNTKPPAPRVKQ